MKNLRTTLAIGATALVAVLISTPPATASPESTSFGKAAACSQPVRPASAGAAQVHLFLCDNGWHGQITGATPGDEIWVTNASGRVTVWRSVPTGATSMNSGTVGVFGSPWRACGKDISRGVIGCTAYN